VGDKSQGLYKKFIVERTDGSGAVGGKHEGCNYFVLDMAHDDHAIPALIAYANSCRAEYPKLAEDLDDYCSAFPAWEERDATEKALHKAVELLDGIQWCSNEDGDCLGHCPYCGASEWVDGMHSSKHDESCRLAAALKGTEKGA
jgi:hypothetical protein